MFEAATIADVKKDALFIFQSAPDLYLILNTEFVIIGASDTFLKATLVEREKVMGKNIFDVFPDNPNNSQATGVKNLRASLERVLALNKPDTMAIQKYDVQKINSTEFEERFWSPQNIPLFDENNKIKYIFHRVMDVTDFVKNQKISTNMEIEIHRYNEDLNRINQQLRSSEAIREAIIQAIPDAMLTINQQGTITDINHPLELLFGYTRAELIGQKMEILLPESYRANHPAHRNSYFKDPWIRPMGNNMNLFGQQKNGKIFSVEISLSPLTTSEGKFAIAIIRDISQRIKQTQLLKEKEIQLTETNEKLLHEKQALDTSNHKRLLLNELGEALITCENMTEVSDCFASYANKILNFSKGVIYLFDASSHVLTATSTWGNILSYEKFFIEHQCWALRNEHFHESNTVKPGLFCEHIQQPIENHSYICVPIISKNERIGIVYLEINDSEVAELTETKLITNMATRILAMSIANIKLRNLLKDQSIRDPLTNLYNRRFLDEYLMKHLSYAKRQKHSIAVILMDIDDFKKVNDTLGHETGDIVLTKLGALLIQLTRVEDICCRYGGEEFVCIFQNCSLTQAKKRAEEIRITISQMSTGVLPKITVSIGLSLFPQDGTEANELLEAADKALYHSKKTGKNKTTIFHKAIL